MDNKHRMDRIPAGMLPLFPSPYPGESFYSILCRYHVRSGNAGDWHTSIQLFGYNTSLISTLLTPFHLDMIRHWTPPASGLDPREMLHQNTAYDLYSINSFPSELDRIQDIIEGRRTAGSFSHWMHPRLINPAGHLRFCPECAAEQIKLYGEPYWQILPQLDEVEYCPRHRIRIRNSPIPVTGIKSHYHPASSVLDKSSLQHPQSTCLQEWDHLFKKEKEFFIRLSCNIDWLLKNGESYAGYQNLSNAYNKLTRARRERSWYQLSKQEIRNALWNISYSSDLYFYLKHKNPKQVGNESYYLYSLRLCSHVLVMTAFCGTPKAFYEL